MGPQRLAVTDDRHAWRDTVARTALGTTELPVGVVTAVIGGPVFVVMLYRREA